MGWPSENAKKIASAITGLRNLTRGSYFLIIKRHECVSGIADPRKLREELETITGKPDSRYTARFAMYIPKGSSPLYLPQDEPQRGSGARGDIHKLPAEPEVGFILKPHPNNIRGCYPVNEHPKPKPRDVPLSEIMNSLDEYEISLSGGNPGIDPTAIAAIYLTAGLPACRRSREGKGTDEFSRQVSLRSLDVTAQQLKRNVAVFGGVYRELSILELA